MVQQIVYRNSVFNVKITSGLQRSVLYFKLQGKIYSVISVTLHY